MTIAAMNKGQNYSFHTLNEYVFQNLCRDLFEDEPNVSVCEVYGVRGQRQYGIDLLGRRIGRDGLEVGQCKCYESFSPAEIAKASDAFFRHWSHWSQKNVRRFILFAACDLSRREQQDAISVQTERFGERDVEYEVWSAAKLRNKLRNRRDLVASYCDPSDYWVNAICGPPLHTSPLVAGMHQGVSVIVNASLVTEAEELATRVSDSVRQELDRAREASREGREREALSWVQTVQRDRVAWQAVPPELKADLLVFEGGLELGMHEDVERAKQLADKAQRLCPAQNQARLRALIAYTEIGAAAALCLLEGQNDIDSVNLRAALQLDVGQTSEALDTLGTVDNGSGKNGQA